MAARRVAALRAAAAVAALAGLGLTALNVWRPEGAVWTTGSYFESTDPALLPSRIANALVWGGGCALLSLAIVWRIRDRAEVLMAALWLGMLSAIPQFQASVLASPATLPFAAIGGGLMNATGIRFTQLFPNRLGLSDLGGLARRPWARWTLGPLLSALLRPWVLFPAIVLVESVAILLSPSRTALLLVLSGVALLASSYLVVGFRVGDAEARRRIFWILEGVVLFLVGNVLLAAVAAVAELGIFRLDVLLWSTWIDVAKGCAVVACFAMALFYSGAFDSGMVLRRSAVYGAAGSLFVVVFLTIETVIAEMLPAAIGLQSRWGAVLAGVVAALTFRPVSGAVDRRVAAWTRAAEPEEDGGRET